MTTSPPLRLCVCGDDAEDHNRFGECRAQRAGGFFCRCIQFKEAPPAPAAPLLFPPIAGNYKPSEGWK